MFFIFGLKKVTIDELAEAVHISKASFYVFYENKEHLFLDIALRRQGEIFDTLNSFLENNRMLPGRDLVYQVFDVMQKALSEYPILHKIDSATIDLISRKVPREIRDAFTSQNIDAAKALHAHGIKFSCDIETASYTFQALFQSWMFLQEISPKHTEAAVKIMLHGIINEIVIE